MFHVSFHGFWSLKFTTLPFQKHMCITQLCISTIHTLIGGQNLAHMCRKCRSVKSPTILEAKHQALSTHPFRSRVWSQAFQDENIEGTACKTLQKTQNPSRRGSQGVTTLQPPILRVLSTFLAFEALGPALSILAAPVRYQATPPSNVEPAAGQAWTALGRVSGFAEDINDGPQRQRFKCLTPVAPCDAVDETET